MGFGAWVTIIAKFLPEFINLCKWISGQVEKGVDIAKIKKTISSIDKVFEYADKIAEWDAKKAAGELDEIFTEIPIAKPVTPKPIKHKLFGKRSDL
jgi:hypothetical protein